MVKRGIGEVARGGGFSAFLSEMQGAGEPMAITKGNEVVAVVMPCNDLMVRYFDDAMTLGKVLALLQKQHDRAVKEYLVHQYMLGLLAKMTLIGGGSAKLVADLENGVAERFHAAMSQNRTEDRATVGTDLSAVPMEGNGRRRKSPASPKQSPPPKR